MNLYLHQYRFIIDIYKIVILEVQIKIIINYINYYSKNYPQINFVESIDIKEAL